MAVRFTPLQTTLATLAAIGIGGTVAYKLTKKKVLKQCKKVVRRDCEEVPLFGKTYCAKKAEEICQA